MVNAMEYVPSDFATKVPLAWNSSIEVGPPQGEVLVIH
jgi:hypothetical protein